MSKKLIAGAICAAAVGLSPAANAVNLKDVFSGDTEFSIGGYMKLSAMWTDLDSGDSSGNTLGDTIYLPSAIPTGTKAAGENTWDSDFTARESRINFKVGQSIGGHKLTAYLEMDFLGTANGNELISNSYSPRLRHGFLKIDNWLFGQTWMTYMDVGALPEAVDFLPASESTVFGRQPQIRYSSGNWQIALENPESWNASGADRDDSDLPDLAANYTFKQAWGHIRLNGLLRELVDQSATSDDSVIGWGIGVTGKVMVGKDDIKFSLNHGDGIGRYIGLAFPRDTTVDASGNTDTTETTAFFAAYRHWWNDQWRSSVIYSRLDMDYENAATGLVDTNESIAINLMYSPVKKVSLGVMYLHGERELDTGAEGDLDRIQFSAKYAF